MFLIPILSNLASDPIGSVIKSSKLSDLSILQERWRKDVHAVTSAQASLAERVNSTNEDRCDSIDSNQSEISSTSQDSPGQNDAANTDQAPTQSSNEPHEDARPDSDADSSRSDHEDNPSATTHSLSTGSSEEICPKPDTQ
jgi:hypothetical protein